MKAWELTADDIGGYFWIQTASLSSPEWIRICFEGFTRDPDPVASSANGGSPYWLILKCSPGVRGVLSFREPSGQHFTGVLVRASAEIWPVEVDWAVSRDGEILEVEERTA